MSQLWTAAQYAPMTAMPKPITVSAFGEKPRRPKKRGDRLLDR